MSGRGDVQVWYATRIRTGIVEGQVILDAETESGALLRAEVGSAIARCLAAELIAAADLCDERRRAVAQ